MCSPPAYARTQLSPALPTMLKNGMAGRLSLITGDERFTNLRRQRDLRLVGVDKSGAPATRENHLLKPLASCIWRVPVIRPDLPQPVRGQGGRLVTVLANHPVAFAKKSGSIWIPARTSFIICLRHCFSLINGLDTFDSLCKKHRVSPK